MATSVAHRAPRQLRLSLRRTFWAVVDAVGSYGTGFRRWLSICLAVFALGLVGAAAALPAGWEVFGTSPTVEWGLLIAAYVFFAITTSGICFTVALGSVLGIRLFKPLERRGVVLAFLSLLSAFWVILLDLQEPVRLIFGAVLSPSPQSPMWWMGVAYAAYLIVLVFELITIFANLHRAHRVAAVAAAVMAFIAPATLGRVFGAIGAKALWQGTLTPFIMFVTALLCGIAILSIVLPITVKMRRHGWEETREHTIPAMRWLLLIVLVVVAALNVVQVVLNLGSDYRGMEMGMQEILTGSYAPAFWTIRVGVGIVLPIVLLFTRVVDRPLRLVEAGAAALIGVLADRYIFVVAAEAKTVTVVAGTVTFPVASYLPSVVEVLIVAGAVAMVAFVYSIIERHVDLSIDEEVEVAA